MGDLIEKIKGIFRDFYKKSEEKKTWQYRYEKLKNSTENSKARTAFEKMLQKEYAGQTLTEEQEAILFSQAANKLYLKNPAGAKYPPFDEYDVERTENTYIVKGFCDSTNSYGAQMRDSYVYEVCKIDNRWTNLTDVGGNALKWFIIIMLVLSLPTIIAYCSFV